MKDAMEFDLSLDSQDSFDMSFDEEEEFDASMGEMQIIETGDYEKLKNLPKIEGHVLIGDKTYSQLGLDDLTPQEIDEIIYGGN